jgi:glycosyltransferase involved in cell wall biosynthesis
MVENDVLEEYCAPSQMEGGYRLLQIDVDEMPEVHQIPLVSIITVVYNGSDSLEKTILSVLSQTCKNLEYIIVDGNSTDDTVDIIRRYEDKISYWISEPDKGISDAWNKGLANARGDIIGILNSGDYYSPDSVEKVVNSIDVNSLSVTYGTTILLRVDGTELAKISGEFNPHNLAGGLGFYHPGCFFTRSAYEKVGHFKLKYRFAMDCDWLIRCHKNGVALKKLDNLCYMPVDGISHASNFSAYGEYLQVLADNGFSPLTIYYYMIRTAGKSILKLSLRK